MQLPEIEPTHAASRITLRVRFCETDLMGIVHHGQYLTYFEAGRVEWLRRRGIAYSTWTAKAIHLPVVDATLRYRAPARFDDLLTVETRIADLRWASVRYEYTVWRDTVVLAEGSTRLACVDDSHKLTRIPAHMLGVLVKGETDDERAAP
jgi:acyl-CoA thioester hydrolase